MPRKRVRNTKLKCRKAPAARSRDRTSSDLLFFKFFNCLSAQLVEQVQQLVGRDASRPKFADDHARGSIGEPRSIRQLRSRRSRKRKHAEHSVTRPRNIENLAPVGTVVDASLSDTL